VGTIVAAGPELQFEGDGTYTVKVSVGPGSGDCLAGPSTTGAFGVDVHVAPVLSGTPVRFRATPVSAFSGVQAAAPPGGEADVRCALNGAIQPDGSVAGAVVVPDPAFAHPSVAESVFPRPGPWTCVARGLAEGRDDNFDTASFGTPWSAPLSFDVRSDFRRRTGTLARGRSKKPRFSFTAEWPAEASGGRATLTVYRYSRCKLRKVAAYRGRFDARRLRVTIRRPPARRFYIGRVAFAGTRFLRASTDPNPVLLQVDRGRLEFVAPSAFPLCA
jgi:hypothetical protein